MPTLTCEISETLMRVLTERSAQTGEPVSHIVMSSLADTLEVDHSTLFQISTSTALVEGIYRGAVTIGELKQHGDFGVGTFEDLDGEMLALDGHFLQVRGTGQVVEPEDRAMMPFAVVTRFRPDRDVSVEQVNGFDSLTAQLDRLRRTDNLFYAVRIDGHFEKVKTRAVCRVATSTSLIQATSSQAEFAFNDAEGTLVGFWTPTFAHNINIPGWHLHFVSRDRSGGGHLLECRAEQLRVALQELADLRIAMPETAAFLQADLSKDPTRDLAVAEGDKHR